MSAHRRLMLTLALCLLAREPLAAPVVLRAAVVPIVGQASFLQTVLAPFLAEKGVQLVVTATHGREVVRAARAQESDHIIIHARVRALGKLEADHTLAPSTPVFANPIALLAPAGDPAHLADSPSAAAAMARLKASSHCLLENHLDGLLDVQRALWGDEGGCRHQDPQAVGLGAVLLAEQRGDYTWWGLHPFVNSQRGMTAMVWPEPELLRTLNAAPVAGARHAALAAEAIAWLASPVGQRAIAAFRLPGQPRIQAWWPPVPNSSTDKGDIDGE